ncbi:hypothetical protein [Dipodfec virus UA06Rod_17]|uniref:Uncharacterized protein n=1 Tax=Dipodfec virus UA06Rod_17 TaxID=2929318 RepID=A0A976N1C0_9VIRU|nr:hypothetical protein [Dipodfec virus UA06Rod_17]
MIIDYIEYICAGCCALFCIVHLVVSLVCHYKQGKKIEKLCDKCGFPLYSDEVHKCLDQTQLLKLIDFVKSLRGDDNGNDN